MGVGIVIMTTDAMIVATGMIGAIAEIVEIVMDVTTAADVAVGKKLKAGHARLFFNAE